MKNHAIPAIGALLLAGLPVASAGSKTAYPRIVAADDLNEKPLRFNGVVSLDDTRGSGFCAWNRHTFFSAAHVVFGEDGSWKEPPVWNWLAHAPTLDSKSAIQSRGYYRWTEYAELAADGLSNDAFGKDVILGFAFRKLMPGPQATLNLKGSDDLKKTKRTMITGYPAEIDYTGKPVNGYFLHQTGPIFTSYDSYSKRALATTLVSTGPGNSGGPIWTRNSKNGWDAAGVLVGGLPSENVVYAFSSDVNTLLRAVSPVIKKPIEEQDSFGSVSATSRFFPNYYRGEKLPDGVHKWTSFKISVRGFEDLSTLEKAKLSLSIRTAHRGDLQVMLEAPGGLQAVIHNEQGGPKDDLIIKNLDLSETFAGIDPNGAWYLRVQDRLKGDVATIKSILLEVAAKAPETTAP